MNRAHGNALIASTLQQHRRRNMRNPLRSSLLWVLFACLAGCSTASEAHTLVTGVELRDTPPPAACPAQLKAALRPGCMVVRSLGEDVLRIWSVRELKRAQSPQAFSDVAYGEIAEGALAGVVEVCASWYDYRDQAVKLGLYTLRYALVRADPAALVHERWRDALFFLPLDKDPDPARVWPLELLRAFATGDREDAIPRRMALFPAQEGRGPAKGDPPRLVGNPLNQPMLSFWVQDINLNLVVAGSVFLSNQQ
ncbi:MAG TPA: hypothetical protein VKA63_07535 [Candidatus Krumholzibacteria bacterium]|nr:hypothetical protein [Candidatus Krumholzibacteria bacterium]